MKPHRTAAEVRFDFPDGRTEFAPGERLRVTATVLNAHELKCRAAEASILWRTVGQGDEDLEVLSFERIGPQREGTSTLVEPIVLEAELPDSPLSYNGVNVKVCWCVRLRLFLDGFREHVAEAPFRLGATWSPQVRESPA